MPEPQTEHRAGFVNLIGNPNVGKSTLMNQLVGEKLSIITAKAQTTRHRIKGIVVARAYEMLEYDIPRAALEQAVVLTPGLESPTVAPLNDPEWAAVKALCLRKGIAETMDKLEALGAKGVVATPIRAARI